MRKTFINSLVQVAEKDPRVVLLTGDLGYTVVEPFMERFKDRFFNVGVAEQNMVGIATGLAEAGYLPYIYSIANFSVLRPYEFIRNGPVVHGFPVRIVGVGGGYEYGPAGISHYSLEDVGVLRLQPGLTIIIPADSKQAENAIKSTVDLKGPIYFRLSKNEESDVEGIRGEFSLDTVKMARPGKDVLILSMGPIAKEAVKAAELLAKDGISCEVGVVSAFTPAIGSDMGARLKKFSKVLTLEAHYKRGGLGTMVAETIAELGLACRLIRMGVELKEPLLTGSETYMKKQFGLSAEDVVMTLKKEKGG